MDMENVTDVKDVFQQLIKNPTKLMGLVKSVGDKLDTRIKSGEIKESELIAEASELMNKMKDMPGMGNIQTMLNKMGMGNLGGLGGKVNAGAMEAELNKSRNAIKDKVNRNAQEIQAQRQKSFRRQSISPAPFTALLVFVNLLAGSQRFSCCDDFVGL
jgi:hypothetical protein